MALQVAQINLGGTNYEGQTFRKTHLREMQGNQA